MAVSRTGDWARARRLLTAAPQRLQAAIGTAVRQEAHALRNDIVQGLTSQAPGGEPLKPPSPLTIAARQLEGFGGSKALIVRGDLRNSITVIVQGDEAFIGVSRSARSKDGASMVDLAKLHEFGGPPVIIPITPKMRRFLFALLRQGRQGAHGRKRARRHRRAGPGASLPPARVRQVPGGRQQAVPRARRQGAWPRALM
jgi:hypothetical protein